MTILERAAIFIVAIHALVGVAHSMSHVGLHIYMSLWQNVYILTVIFVLPIVSGVLIWRRARAGFFLLFCSMLGSLLFGGYYHFIASGPDNVNSLDTHPWALPFQISALLLAVTEAGGAVVAVVGLQSERKIPR